MKSCYTQQALLGANLCSFHFRNRFSWIEASVLQLEPVQFFLLLLFFDVVVVVLILKFLGFFFNWQLMEKSVPYF